MQQVLTRIFSASTTVTRGDLGGNIQISDAFGEFMNMPGSRFFVQPVDQTINQIQLERGPFTQTLATGCLSGANAAIVLLEIRRAMHADLGLPAPAN